VLHLVGGYAATAGLSAMSVQDWDSMQAMLVRTTFCVVRAFAAPLAASQGRFVGVTSPKAQAPTAKSAVYSMSKAAADALVLALADELRGSGATANLLVVDSIDTPEARGKEGAKPSPRSTPAEKIAATMLLLCAAEAGAINGARLSLTGK
jgi:NAD(P)-dependent dehydrogenase (short-subunit alcohol dehydrogenase family)